MPLAEEIAVKNSPLPESDAHMQDFKWFIGEWDVQSRMLMDAEKDEWLEESLTTIHTYEMNGHIIFEHFFGPIAGKPFEGWSLRKYNSSTERWQQKWMDSSAPMILDWGGTFNESGEYVGFSEMYLTDTFEIAGEKAARETFFNITDDHFSWRYERTGDGGKTWQITWTLEYNRRK